MVGTRPQYRFHEGSSLKASCVPRVPAISRAYSLSRLPSGLRKPRMSRWSDKAARQSNFNRRKNFPRVGPSPSALWAPPQRPARRPLPCPSIARSRSGQLQSFIPVRSVGSTYILGVFCQGTEAPQILREAFLSVSIHRPEPFWAWPQPGGPPSPRCQSQRRQTSQDSHDTRSSQVFATFGEHSARLIPPASRFRERTHLPRMPWAVQTSSTRAPGRRSSSSSCLPLACANPNVSKGPLLQLLPQNPQESHFRLQGLAGLSHTSPARSAGVHRSPQPIWEPSPPLAPTAWHGKLETPSPRRAREGRQGDRQLSSQAREKR